MKNTQSFDNQSLCYETIDSKNQQTLMLIPGFAMDHTLWGKFCDVLSQNYNLILIDHRGTGLNTALTFQPSLAVLAKDIISILNAQEIHNINLVGCLQHFFNQAPFEFQ